MRKEDEKLRQAICKHYKKLVALERERKKNTNFRFSDCVTDLMTVFGFKKSQNNEDELSKESSS